MKSFRSLLTAQALFFSINGMLYPIMALYVWSISNDYFLVGLMFAIPFLISVPMNFVWGSISDILGNRKKVVAFGGLVGGLLFFAFPFASVTELFILRCIQMVFLSSFVLLNAVVTEYFPMKKGRSIGTLSVFAGAGAATGALAAGLLVPAKYLVIGSDQITWFFTICGLLAVSASLVILTIKEVKKRRVVWKAKDFFRFGESRQIAIICAVAFMFPLSGFMIYSIFPVYISELVTSNSSLVVGLFAALANLSGIFGGAIAGHMTDKLGRRSMLIGAGAAYAIIFFGMGMTKNLVLLAILWSLPIWSFFIVSSTAMVSDITKKEERGRGIGVMNSAVNLGAATGGIFSGYMMSTNPELSFFILSSVLAVVGTIVALGTRETLKKRRGHRRDKASS